MKTWLQSIRMMVVMTLLTGLAYPLAVSGLARGFFRHQADGSLVRKGETAIGSEWIEQKFSKPGYFWPRPSAADFNPQPSTGSNLGPTSKDLLAKVQERRSALEETLRLSGAGEIPQDLLFASASGADPHISPEAAFFQANRVTHARGLGADQADKLKSLISENVEDPQLGFLGQARVNVLKLNLALDKEFPEPGS